MNLWADATRVPMHVFADEAMTVDLGPLPAGDFEVEYVDGVAVRVVVPDGADEPRD